MNRKSWRQHEIENLWSTPITNILQKDMALHEQYAREYMLFHRRRREAVKDKRLNSPVPWHKDVLGEQAYCFTGWRRYWVWQHTEEREHHTQRVWRVFVSNIRGIGFEVARKFSPQEAMEAWHHYLRAMGMEDVVGAETL